MMLQYKQGGKARSYPELGLNTDLWPLGGVHSD